jgi:hypothetical protein
MSCSIPQMQSSRMWGRYAGEAQAQHWHSTSSCMHHIACTSAQHLITHAALCSPPPWMSCLRGKPVPEDVVKAGLVTSR